MPRSLARGGLLCLLLSAVIGCTVIKDNYNKILDRDPDSKPKPAELVQFPTTLKVTEAWSGSFGSGAEKQYLKLTPAYADGRIYTADRDGRVMAVDAQKGSTIWELRDKKQRISGGPGVGEGLVMVGTSKAMVLAYDAATGKPRWATKVSSEVLSPPVASDGVVIVRAGDGKMMALGAADGKLHWTYDRSIPTLTLRGSGTPVIHENLVVAGFDNGRLVALDLHSGKTIWETRLAEPTGRSDLERMVDVDSEPVIAGNTAYVACFQGRVAAVALDDGRVEWTRDISSYADLSVDDERLYVTDDKGTVWALKLEDGSDAWKQPALLNRAPTGPTRIDDFVVVGDFEGYLHFMDRYNGKFAQRVRVDKKRILTSPIRVDDLLLGYSSAGELVAYRLH
ncbi:MAG: outer membrane protein assembly factor BamB [Gammaproteobacteria bacterium]|nr:outer membrane protein assembly factor BamB [Gammaproteobacteria bacterium]MBI5615730.1 outer membrane protein assembly factor BamB [Gammaproteobacteria bacterium]